MPIKRNLLFPSLVCLSSCGLYPSTHQVNILYQDSELSVRESTDRNVEMNVMPGKGAVLQRYTMHDPHPFRTHDEEVTRLYIGIPEESMRPGRVGLLDPGIKVVFRRQRHTILPNNGTRISGIVELLSVTRTEIWADLIIEIREPERVPLVIKERRKYRAE